MNTEIKNRLKHGLFWYGDTKPYPTLKQIASAAFAALIVTAGWLYVAWSDAEAGMIEAQAKQIKTEVALVTILNGDPLIIDKDSGTVALARVEVYGDPK